MKKFQFAVLAFAAICMIACKDKKEEPQTPDEPETEYKCPITIDGTGAEYDALNNVVISKNDEGCGNWQGLKLMKVYSDEVYTCIYMEYDKEEFPLSLGWEGGEDAGAQIHIYTSDDTTKAGFIAQTCNPLCYLYEGSWALNGVINEALEFGGVFGWPKDKESSNEWPWEEVAGAANPVANFKAGNNSLEIQLNTPSLLGATGDFFFLGVDLQDNWESVGVLPNAADEINEEEGTSTAVLAAPLKVVINKVE